MRRAGKPIGPITFVAALCLWLGPSAQASVVSGSSLTNAPNSAYCESFMGSVSCTAAISALPSGSRAPGGARVETDGVIVGWSVRTAGGASISVRLRVIRGVTAVGTGPVETLPLASGIKAYPARIAVKEGDEIGIDTLNVPAFTGVPIIQSGDDNALIDFWNPPLGETEMRAPTGDDSPEAELLINATIEPDADRDGFGDETQDGCPSVANGGGSCPPTSISVQVRYHPDTVIKKGPFGEVRTHRATFRFRSDVAGASFECKLDKQPFRPCVSPKRYRKLSSGRHKFQVRAVDATGEKDASPAKRTFRITD